jgi:hypothetical protein
MEHSECTSLTLLACGYGSLVPSSRRVGFWPRQNVRTIASVALLSDWGSIYAQRLVSLFLAYARQLRSPLFLYDELAQIGLGRVIPSALREALILEAETDLLWNWLRNSNQASAFSLVLPFLLGATLGATLASLVTWIEGRLAIAGKLDARINNPR